ncbi:hypothetical protein FLAN108750_10460 [Flavobacterium antarcticum]|uniref:hypothetical protein n=1 Tax=Flavobacterium antarcticum TaxID=271155 RepID=UPI0003B56D5C|nr:hypothetical protein [Flavobacterium antarcticum]
MVKNTLEDYKAAIKRKYSSEKTGVAAPFLAHPSRAKLRKWCAEIFLQNTSVADLKSFSAFFKFDYGPNCCNKLKEQTDKFRPIETFFKGETDLTDIEAMNIAAILVDFQPRPFFKFSKEVAFKTDPVISNNLEVTDTVPFAKMGVETDNRSGGVDPFLQKVPAHLKIRRAFYKKQIVPFILLFSILCGFGYLLSPKKKCMQWQKDHYIAVDCETKSTGILDLYTTMPLNNELLNLRKIQVCDTTIFFRHNKPVVWYSKTNNNLEFFNGPGFHPENGKVLKPITFYMIHTHIKPAH